MTHVAARGAAGTVVFGPSCVHLETGLREELSRYAEVEFVHTSSRRFPDGETAVNLGQAKIGEVAVVVQGTQYPQAEHFLQLLQMIDVAQRRGASRIVCVIPYFGYGRQDKHFSPGEPVTAELILRFLKALGCDLILTVDMHDPAVGARTGVRIVDLCAAQLLGTALMLQSADRILWVSPDAGGAARIARAASTLDGDYMILEKVRCDDQIRYHGDVDAARGRDVFVVDDICSTGSTLAPLVEVLVSAGAKRVRCFVTHLLADPAAIRLRMKPNIEIYSANTIANAAQVVHVERSLAKAIMDVLSTV